ncbi:MAG: rhomboid family intramembrane serine protease [Candidatus Krumholzibacteriia bacterium]
MVALVAHVAGRAALGSGVPGRVLATLDRGDRPLLHADWLHLAGNLVYLVAFLPALEERLGRLGLLLLVLATGIGGNLCHGVASWHGWLGQTGLGILGASGAISGLLGYALLRLPHARVKVAYWVLAPLQGQNRAGRTSLPLPVAVLGWLLLQVASALLAGESGSTVSYAAHLGGFLGGLVMGLLLGGVGEGREEACLLAARRHLEAGSGWPAVGAYSEYLQTSPDDVAARCELARAYLLAGVRLKALAAYQEAYRRASGVARWDQALDVLAEGRRLQPGLNLPTEGLGEAAQQADRAGRLDLAVGLYQDLVRRPGPHPVIERGWVRLVLLLHGRPEWQQEAAEWLAAAAREMPAGAWRDYLEREFTLPAGPHAGSPQGPAVGPRARGS